MALPQHSSAQTTLLCDFYCTFHCNVSYWTASFYGFCCWLRSLLPLSLTDPGLYRGFCCCDCPNANSRCAIFSIFRLSRRQTMPCGFPLLFLLRCCWVNTSASAAGFALFCGSWLRLLLALLSASHSSLAQTVGPAASCFGSVVVRSELLWFALSAFAAGAFNLRTSRCNPASAP